MNIGKSIGVGIALRNIKSKDIASNLGVTQVTVSNWRQSKRDPSIENIEKMAELFGVKVSTFIEWGEE